MHLLKLLFAVFRLVSTRHQVGGLKVLLIGSPPNASRYLAELAAAVELLNDDPRRWRLVHRHIKYILIAEYGGGSFIPTLRVCALGTAVLQRGPLYTAGVIVHEMTHARLFECGFTYGPETREREEALCVKEALRFLNRTSEGRSIAELYAAHAAQAFLEPEPWYSDRQRVQYGSKAMDFYGIPKWLQSVRRLFIGRH